METKKIFYIIVALQVIFLLGMIALKQSTVAFGTRVVLKTLPYDPTEFFRGDYINIRYEISNIDPSTLKNDNKDFAAGEAIYARLEKTGDYWKVAEISHSKLQNPYIKGIVKGINMKVVYTIKETNSSKDYKYEETIPYLNYGYRDYLQAGDKVQFTVFNDVVSYPYKCENGICPYTSEPEKPVKRAMDALNVQDQYHVGTITNVQKDLKELNVQYPIESYYVPKNEGNLPQFRNGEMKVEVALWHGDAIATNILINGQSIDFR